jgi:xanthine dehydrogenase/oxidase
VTAGHVDDPIWNECDIIIEGTVKCGSQYHFHMENQTAYAVPLDDDKLKIYAANQMPANLQSQIAQVLDCSSNCLEIEVKRCGGGYGGKLENSIVVAAATALAARKFNAPVRVVLTLNDNMKALGKRHPSLANYKLGIKKNGKLIALKADVFVDGGATSYATDGEAATLLANFDNAYYCPNYYVSATLCKTNTPSNTWTRGPGWIPAVYLMEHIMEHAAGQTGMSAEDFKRMNFYVKNQKTPPGQKLAYWNLDTIWDQLVQTADLNNLKQHVSDYNKNNYWTKKGISVVPVKFGVGWGGPQHGAKIDIYTDGSISVSHTGVEIGQGLNTKVAQVVAYQLGVPMDLIKIEPTTSLAIPNGSATGGSVTSALVSRVSSRHLLYIIIEVY